MNGRPWKPHEITLVQAWFKLGMTLEEIGEAMDRSTNAIKEKVYRPDNIITLYTNGMGYRKAGALAGVSERTARRVLTRAGVMRDPPPMEPAPPAHDDVLRIELKKAKKVIVSPYIKPQWFSNIDFGGKR